MAIPKVQTTGWKRRSFLLLVVWVAAEGCWVGGLKTADEIVASPAGIRLDIETPAGRFFGELLEVRRADLVVLIDTRRGLPMDSGPLVLVRSDGLARVRAGTDGPGGREEGRAVELDSDEDWDWLRGLSRFPYGMADGVEERLLSLHGQVGIEVVGSM